MTDFPDWMLRFAHLETAKRHAREAVTEHYRARLLDESPKFDTSLSAAKVAAIRNLKTKQDRTESDCTDAEIVVRGLDEKNFEIVREAIDDAGLNAGLVRRE